MLGDPITELSIALELDYFQLNSAEYFISLVVKIPGRELALAKRTGAELTQMHFLAEVKDEFGTTEKNLRDQYGPKKLADATAAELAKAPIEYATSFTLLPGKKRMKFLARNDETGRIGTYETTFEIPNLDKVEKEGKRLPVSSVVLSSQKVDLNNTLFNASLKEKDKTESTNPLVVEGEKLIPSVTRVFSRSKDMFVYLQAYEMGAESIRPLVAYVTFYKGDEQVYETEPIQVAQAMTNRLKTMPLHLTVPMSQLAPGEYKCQVSVLDPNGQKAAFWVGPVVVVQ